ncbi:hypothetical protein GI584_05480 [Gracilibacillus salitolerans]|uniref:Uncharacterized protein n=2 Tax=Gracilibacillus salitolerans TaxID=2663022 RepID=A0A5Q2TH92_9BACI|nr:hypothetical protein GI584_05480 [Gracilibacillus salitolerans]
MNRKREPIMPSIHYGTTTIQYCHYKQTRKDVKISIDLLNGVEVFTLENLNESKLIPTC